MGSNSGKQREQDLARQRTEDRASYQQQAAEAKKPSALESRLEGDALSWLDFVEGKNGPVDYTKAPGLVHLGMFDEAAANRFAERTATGGLQMGAEGGNATALAMRKSQVADQMAERRGASLVDAVRTKDAAVRGQVAPFLIGTREGRNQNILSTAAGMSQSSTQAYASLPLQQPWWQVALGAGLGAAGSMFAGGFSRRENPGGFQAADYWSSGRAATPLGPWFNSSPNPYSTYK